MPTDRLQAMDNRVYKFGCRAPREEALALQMLGQSWLYADDLRRAYNAHKRERRAWLAGLAEGAHVQVHEAFVASTDDVAHVFDFGRHQVTSGLKERLNAAIRGARARRASDRASSIDGSSSATSDRSSDRQRRRTTRG